MSRDSTFTKQEFQKSEDAHEERLQGVGVKAYKALSQTTQVINWPNFLIKPGSSLLNAKPKKVTYNPLTVSNTIILKGHLHILDTTQTVPYNNDNCHY